MDWYFVQEVVVSAMGEEAELSSPVGENETLEQIKSVHHTFSVVAYIIITIGVLGNVLSLIVLTRPNMKVRIIGCNADLVQLEEGAVCLPAMADCLQLVRPHHRLSNPL